MVMSGSITQLSNVQHLLRCRLDVGLGGKKGKTFQPAALAVIASNGNSEERVLAIDVGTGGTKAALVSPLGAVTACAFSPHPNPSPSVSWVLKIFPSPVFWRCWVLLFCLFVVSIFSYDFAVSVFLQTSPSVLWGLSLLVMASHSFIVWWCRILCALLKDKFCDLHRSWKFVVNQRYKVIPLRCFTLVMPGIASLFGSVVWVTFTTPNSLYHTFFSSSRQSSTLDTNRVTHIFFRPMLGIKPWRKICLRV